MDTRTDKIIKRIAVGHVPRGLSVSADGKQIYVANSWTDTVSVIDAQKLAVTRSLATGFEPISALPDRQDATLYVANRLSSDISVIDLRSGQEIKRLAAGRGASYLALSADGKKLFCSHIYPAIGEHRAQPQSEITVVDTTTRRVMDREPLHNVAGVFHMAISGDGKLGVAAHLRPKNLIPLAHVEHGWVFTDSLVLFGEDAGGVLQVPLDELDHYFALPYGVAITPDKSRIFVSSAGSDYVSVVGIPALLKYVRGAHESFANDLSASANYVTARIPVGRNPRGIVLSPDGKRLYVAARMDDKITVIDARLAKVVSTIDLGGPKTVSALRRGEQLFYSAHFAFQGHFGCANCHIEGTLDGLSWDLEPDGFGVDIVDNRLLEEVADTAPYKWNGGNPDLETECGPRTEKYFYRAQSYSPAELTDLVSFIKSIPSRPNRYRSKDGELTAQQQRGLTIFTRTLTKSGKQIDYNNQCVVCHNGPHYTNLSMVDVGTGKATDRSPLVDVPQLNNVVLSAPYLHDGSARTLEEIWTVFNPHDRHGVTNDLSKDELNDLIEYLKTL